MLRHLLIFILIVIAHRAAAQQSIWALGAGASANDKGKSIATDSQGNIYVIGSFAGDSVDFDPHPVDTLILRPVGDEDLFIAKYTPAGNIIWAFNIGGNLTDAALGITLDDNNNIYITGYFRDFVDFNPDPLTSNVLFSNGDGGLDLGYGGDIFVASYDANGNYRWAFNIGGSSLQDSGGDVLYDGQGHIYIAGYFSGTAVDFNPSPAYTLLNSQTGGKMFLAKYTTNGALVRAFNIGSGGNADETPRKLAKDAQGNIYVTGFFQSDFIDFDPGPGNAYLTSHGSYDIFLAKYDSTFNYHWAFNIGTDGIESGWDVDVDAAGNVYIGGYFQGFNVDFNTGPGTNNLNAVGGIDAFVAKYNSNGQYQWAFNIGGHAREEVFSLDVQGNELVVTGFYLSDSIDIDPSSSVKYLKNYGGGDIFIAKYDLNGAFKCGFHVGSNKLDIGQDVWLLDNGEVYLTGSYQGSNTDFNPSSGVTAISSIGNEDYFLTRYNWISTPPNGTLIGGINCEGFPAMLTFNATSGIGPFELELTDGTNTYHITNVQSGVPFVISNNLTATTTFQLLAIGNDNQCAAALSINQSATITVRPKPQASFTVSDLCETDPVSITLNALAGTDPFQITLTDGAQNWTLNNVLSGSPFTIPASFAASTVLAVKNVTDANGCGRDSLFGQDSIHLTIKPSPQGIFEGNLVCNVGDGLVKFTASRGTGPFNIQFTQGTHTFSINNYTSGAPVLVSNNPGADTTYTLLRVTGSNGCVRNVGFNQAVAKVEVNTISVAASSITASKTNICEGENITLQINGGSLGSRAKWLLYADACGTNKMDSTITNSFSIQPLQTTTYFIRAENNCDTTLCRAISITVNKIPQLHIASAPEVCDNDQPLQITPPIVTNNVQGIGVFTGSGVSPTGMYSPASVNTLSSLLTYTFVSDAGCSAAVQQIINIKTSPRVNSGLDKTILVGGKTLLEATISGATDSVRWTPDYFLQSGNSLITAANPDKNTIYTLYAYGTNGCIGKDEVQVNVAMNVAIPNVFSPNGDGINDNWSIPYLETYPNCRVSVYNRYGNIVYKSSGVYQPWNGKIKGKDAPAGTYYYLIEPNINQQKYTGWLLLVK